MTWVQYNFNVSIFIKRTWKKIFNLPVIFSKYFCSKRAYSLHYSWLHRRQMLSYVHVNYIDNKDLMHFLLIHIILSKILYLLKNAIGHFHAPFIKTNRNTKASFASISIFSKVMELP